jgi:hypothetical protein
MCSPALLSLPHLTLGQSWVRTLSHRWEDRAPPCDLPTAYITSRASIGECVPPHAAQEPNNRHLSKQLGPSVPAYPRVCCASLLHQHRLTSFTLQR